MDPLVREREPARLDDPVAQRDGPPVLDQRDRRGAAGRDRIRQVPDGLVVEVPLLLELDGAGDAPRRISSPLPVSRPTSAPMSPPNSRASFSSRPLSSETSISPSSSFATTTRSSRRTTVELLQPSQLGEDPLRELVVDEAEDEDLDRAERGRRVRPAGPASLTACPAAGASGPRTPRRRARRAPSAPRAARAGRALRAWAAAAPRCAPAVRRRTLAGVVGRAADHRRAHQGPPSPYAHCASLLSVSALAPSGPSTFAARRRRGIVRLG